MEYASINYASNGILPEKIGATGQSVEQFEVTPFFERGNNFLSLLQNIF